MSKSAKICILILIILLLGSVGYSAYLFFVEIKQLNENNVQLTTQLDDAEIAQQKDALQIKKLADEKKGIQSKANESVKKLKVIETKAARLQKQIDEFKSKDNQTKNEIKAIKAERDQLKSQIKEAQEKLKSAETEVLQLTQTIAQIKNNPDAIPSSSSVSSQANPTDTQPSTEMGLKDDGYWAKVLKDKAELKVKYDSLKDELAKTNVGMVDIKQKNIDLKLEMDNLKQIQAEVSREIEYKDNMINNLSLELARTKSDHKFHLEKFKTLSSENQSLRDQLQKVINVKTNLEKSVLQLTQDKNRYERELGKTEVLIQNKIDEMWEIKDTLDQTVQNNKAMSSDSNIELQPIVVPMGDQSAMVSSAPVGQPRAQSGSVGYQGKVLSYNRDNNFVIVNIGESARLKLGETLSVYRNSKYVARLEVIQVRKDIAAADIKEQWLDIEEGDIVR